MGNKQAVARELRCWSDGYMSHPIKVKAEALALLMVGNSDRYVSQETGVPLTTIKRWRKNDMRQLMREIFPPDFGRSLKMDLKKRLGA